MTGSYGKPAVNGSTATLVPPALRAARHAAGFARSGLGCLEGRNPTLGLRVALDPMPRSASERGFRLGEGEPAWKSPSAPSPASRLHPALSRSPYQRLDKGSVLHRI